jgi:hypothetical protein
VSVHGTRDHVTYQRMRCAGHVARTVLGAEEMRTGCWWGDMRERDHLEDLGVNRRIILKWICKKDGEA